MKRVAGKQNSRAVVTTIACEVLTPERTKVTARVCVVLVPERKRRATESRATESTRKQSTALSAYSPFATQQINNNRDNRDNVDIVIRRLIARKRELERETLQITEAIRTLTLQK